MKTINLLVAGLFAAVAPCAFAATLHSAEVDGVRWLYTERGGNAILGESLRSVAIIGDVPSKVVIPSAFGNMPVVSIGRYAFRNLKEITEVIIPDSVTTIEEQAFDGCRDSLFNTTTIPGVRLVDGWAIDYTDSLSGELNLSGVRGVACYAFRGCTTISSVTIPNGLTRIDTCTFLNCTNLASVTMPDSLVYIGQSAFSGCSGLSSVKIPENVENIDYRAFYGCSALTTVAIPDRTETIGSEAFNNCSALESVTISDSVMSIGTYAFRGCKNSLFDTTTIPGLVLVDGWAVDNTGTFTGHLDLSGCRGIAAYAFRGSNGLSSITIPGSVAGMSSYAFYGNTNLTSVIFQDGVKRIGNGAFYNCTRLADVRLPETLTHIENGAFYNCTSLSEVRLPETLIYIGSSAFYNCTSLFEVRLPETLVYIESSAFGNCSGLASITIPDTAVQIATDAFIDCRNLAEDGFVIVRNVVYDYYGDAGDVVIPDGVMTIGQKSFRDRLSIRRLTIPEGVTNIEDYAFANCTNLVSISLPQSLLRIGEYAFDGCLSLTRVTIPTGVKSIGSNAFGGCGGIEEFGVDDGNDSYKSVSGLLLTVDGTTLLAGVNGDVEIPIGVETIDEYAFSGRSKLASVSIPATVSFVGHYAFSGCSLADVRFEWQKGFVFVDYDAFSDVKSVVMIPDEGHEFVGWTGGNGAVMSPIWRSVIKDDVVSFRQRYPWNGLVDIDFTVKCEEPTNINIFVSAKDESTGKALAARNIWLENDAMHTNALVVQRGAHRLVWDARADFGKVRYDNVVAQVQVAGGPRKNVQLWSGGPYWATTNIGAEKPWESGCYFWWGDTIGCRREGNGWVASDGSFTNYSFSSINTPTYNKSIVTLQSEGWIASQDGTYVLAPEHDAAQVQWGGGWRMPTRQELNDLCNKCDWMPTMTNGVNGCMVQGRGSFSANSIFFPCVGYASGTTLVSFDLYGFYDSSVPLMNSIYSGRNSWGLGFYKSGSNYYTSDYSRYSGHSIRPVQDVNAPDALPEKAGHIGTSMPSKLNTTLGVQVVMDGELIPITYSPRWGNAASCTVTVATSASGGDGGNALVATATEEGEYEWLPSGIGMYTLTHTAGDLVYTVLFTVLGDDVVTHAGALTANETWSADKVHLVTADVTVPNGVSLLIEPGAVVKFMPGTSLTVANGATCMAIGVVFTHANDDTLQGDTLFDGETAPVQDDYKIVGIVNDDGTTEYRYMAPQELTSNVTSNLRLRGHRVYVVSNDVTVASGATLTILPGAVLKFASGKSLIVNSGGTLNAQGTRALPIVLTSIKDDSVGGDTNGDGDSSTPAPNDWRSVKVSGTANFDNVKMLYGGGASDSSNSGMLIGNSGGKIALANCVLAHGLYDGIFSYAQVTAENCAIYDYDRGINTRGGSGVFKNCVIDKCRWGVMAEGGSGTYYNCIITRFFGSTGWPTGWGVAYWSGSLRTYNCCVYSTLSGASNYRSSPTVVNNISSDPRFNDADNGDFRIAADSPCVDAGDAAYAPKADYFGQKRVSVYEREDGALGERALPDIGIHEVMPREVKSDVDLAVESVVAPEMFVVGEKISVTWNVKNVGSETVSGTWGDKVELVCANGSAVELGTVTTSATIPADGVQTFSGAFTVPSAQVGTVRVRVTANANRDIFEGTLTANNSAESEVAKLTMPELVFPESGVASFSVTAGRSVGYRLGDGFAEGGLLIVHAESATAGGVKVWTGNGQVPTADIFYAAAVEVGGGDYLVRVPPGGDAYVAFANEGSGIAKVEVGTEAGAFLLFDTGVVTAPNAGTASLTLFGNGFDDGIEVWVEKGGMRVGASEVVIFDPVKAVATFDVTGLAAGAYEVHVKNGDAEDAATLLSLTETRIGPKWSCKLDIASSVRSSREYVGYLEYANTGDMPLDAPYVKITSGSGSFIRFGTADAWGDTLELMAVSETYPASQLKPGETRRIPFRYKTTGSSLSVECGYTQDDPGAFPWDTNASYMRPSWASDELWGLSLAVLKSNVGATWNDYLARMRTNCDHLAKIGQPTYRLDRIWQLEINEALGVDHAVSTLASNTDLARSGRGFGLALSRSYGSGLYRRLRKGIFGYGWSDNYSAYAELQNSGATLSLHSGSGSTYLFEKVNGKWTPEDARDKTTCTETSTEYVLKYRSGTEQRIAKSSMRVTSVKDNQGNALTLTYNADKQLVKVEHCDGQSLSFAYANGLLVSAADDQGRTTTYEYSGDMLVKVTAFNGLSTQYRYLAADGSVTSRALRQVVYADGTTRDYTYDGAGHVATVAINGNLQMVEIVRGALGSYSVIAPSGGETTVLLGASGEVLETINALGQKSTRIYTADTLLEAVVGPTGKRAKIGYDEDGQAVKATDAAGADTHFAYTSDFGNLAKVTDARGNSFDYGYDKLGRSKSISYADGSIESIAYNDRGDVTSSINRRGQSITFTYDDEGNTLSKVWDNGRTFTWSYDAKGNCTNATDSVTGTVVMEYDANERLTRIVHPKGRGFAYEYDALGRTISRTTLRGAGSVPTAADIQRYSYDSLGRLARMTDGDGNLYVENAYDPTTGWLITQTYGNGTIVSNAYDILGRTIGIYHGRAVSMKPPYLAFFEYEYDAEGRRISQATAEGVERYTYDTVGQLTGVIYPDGTEEHFTYDAVGNRITANGERYEANNLNQYTTIFRDSASPREETIAYDLDGNMTRKGDTLYYYDIQNRLVAVTNTTKDIAWSCEYDVFGNRTKVIDNGTTKETLFIQGSLASAVVDYDASGDLSTRHILLGSVRLADITTPNSPTPNSQTLYYHADGLASTRLLTDANGDMIGTASYNAFGSIRTTGGSQSLATITSAGWVGTLGVERDDATGLVFMRNRYYDSEQGRFIQMDPIGLRAGDINIYKYCDNGIGKIDVDGYKGVCVTVYVSAKLHIGVGVCVGKDDDTGKWLFGGTLTHGVGLGGGIKATYGSMHEGYTASGFVEGHALVGKTCSVSDTNFSGNTQKSCSWTAGAAVGINGGVQHKILISPRTIFDKVIVEPAQREAERRYYEEEARKYVSPQVMSDPWGQIPWQ